ncbi:MAG: hypothetical protein LBM78_03120 [Clostridiales bacterium]|jgi:predicted  nucleic acid-binding Zn-ribbon protein|nr:hypothetical protein [Clostridiales bacterium]
MSKFSAILDYQKIDLQLARIEREISGSEAKRTGDEAKRSFDDARQRVTKADEHAGVLAARIEELQEYMRKLQQHLELLERRLSTSLSDETYAELKKQCESLSSGLAGVEKQLAAVDKPGLAVIKDSDAAYKDADRSRDVHRKAKEAYAALKAGKAGEIEALRAQLAEKEKTVTDAKLMEHYKRLRADNKLPAVVPLVRGNSCGGCQMEQAVGTIAAIKTNGSVECENCHRLIYNVD